MSRTKYSWDDLIPVEEAKAAASFLVTTWKQCIKTFDSDFKFTKREPQLTELLMVNINKLKAVSGLSGFWENESQVPRLEGRVVKRTKTDIKYQSNKGIPIELVFEFKKVKSNSLATYKNESGMRRFVDGYYSVKQPLAAMVAIIEAGTEKDISDNLIRALSHKDSYNNLRMVQNSKGEYIRRPSELLESIAAFDTEHSRPKDQAPVCGTTTLSHILLESAK